MMCALHPQARHIKTSCRSLCTISPWLQLDIGTRGQRCVEVGRYWALGRPGSPGLCGLEVSPVHAASRVPLKVPQGEPQHELCSSSVWRPAATAIPHLPFSGPCLPTCSEGTLNSKRDFSEPLGFWKDSQRHLWRLGGRGPGPEAPNPASPREILLLISSFPHRICHL